MIDISRCKVPRLSTLRGIISGLAKLRYNQLQLYTEHTFAFPGHRQVWGEASPLTPLDYRKLDKLCRAHGIELVPNFNCFGHLERWLRHAPYQELAEHPEPFTNDFGTYYPNGATLRPDEVSAEFIDRLLGDFLPCFKSEQVHIGCDETWELGRGWSAPQTAKVGVGRVYLDHLHRLHRRVRDRGKTPQFWADIVFQHPELIPELPSPGLPVVWGYERNHPFDAQCRTLRDSGFPFLVAPGTSSWLSLTSRWTNAHGNIENALRNAIDYGASGMLLTDWGDRGHHQSWIVSLPAIVAAGVMAWNGTMPDEKTIRRGVALAQSWRDSSSMPEILIELARLDQHFSRARHNWSPLYELLIADRNELVNLSKEISCRELEMALDGLRKLRSRLIPGEQSERHARRELILTMGLVELGLCRGLGQAAGTIIDPLLNEYRSLWLKRNRQGGLKESIELLKRIPFD